MARRKRDLVEVIDQHQKDIAKLRKALGRVGTHTHDYLPLTGGTVNGATTIDGGTGPALKLRNNDSDGAQLRLVDEGDPNAVLLRNDGSTFYFLVTDTEDGVWNSLRPFYFSLSTGAVTIAEDTTVSGTLNVNTIQGGSSLNLYGESNDSLRITSGETFEWWPSDTRRWYIDNSGFMTWTGDATLRRNGSSTFLTAGATYTQLHNPAGTVRLWVGASDNYYNATTHNFRDTASTVVAQITGGQIRVNDGSSSSPTYSFRNQTNSGMLWAETTKRIYLTNQGTLSQVVTTGGTYPATSNVQQLGNATLDWKDVWAIDTTINSSDERLKDDLTPIPVERAKDIMRALPGVWYKWKDGGKRIHASWGARAVAEAYEEAGLDPGNYGVYIDPTFEHDEEYLAAFPEAKTDEHASSLRIRPGELAPVHWQITRSQMAEIDELRARVEALESSKN